MSVKQDGARVRSAYDLECKYKLADMQRAYEQSEKSITKLERILQDFVNVIVGTLDNFEGLTDGNLVTYFDEGIPTLENYPSSEWTDGYDFHINDMYYDKETGKAYIFVKTEDSYTWEETTSKDKIKVLAMANATVDTKDKERKIFVEQPIPPYKNGDLWVKDGNIYVCQIAKPSTEMYEEHDFILSSKYSGDTLAIKVGTELEVLRGTVLKVIEDADFLRVELNDLDNETTSSIELLKNMLSTLITDENGQSMMVQTPDGWKFEMKSILESLSSNTEKVGQVESNLNETSSDLANVKDVVATIENTITYVSIGTRDDKPCIELGAKDSKFKVIITNEEILFTEGSSVPAYISNETLYISRANVEKELQIGTLAFVKRANGHITLMPKGVE